MTICSGWIWVREPACSPLSFWALCNLGGSQTGGYSLVSLDHEELACVGPAPKERLKLSRIVFGRVLNSGPGVASHLSQALHASFDQLL